MPVKNYSYKSRKKNTKQKRDGIPQIMFNEPILPIYLFLGKTRLYRIEPW